MAVFEIRVIPNASRAEVLGWAAERGGALKVKVPAPAEGGRANKAVLLLLAEFFGVSKRAVRLVSGEKSRLKRVEVEGLGAAQVEARVDSIGA